MLRRSLLLSGMAAPLVAACVNSPAPRLTGAPDEIAALADGVRAARAESDLAALGVMVARDGEPLVAAIEGVRARGTAIAATLHDRWHIGSCTKSMTATLLARFVARGEADWDAPVSELLQDIASGMHPQARDIKLAHLLTGVSGLPEYPSYAATESGIIADIEAIAGSAPTPAAQRLITAERMLAKPPLFSPGTDWLYCSTGFIIAGAVAEHLGGAPYESLLRREVLAPLGVRDFGFGAPGSRRQLDEPRGHAEETPGTPVSPTDPHADNPAYFAPAGGLNITLGGWAAYAYDHVAGARGEGRLFGPEVYARLHRPALEGGKYAFGWGVLVRDGESVLLTHNGSNGLWFSDLRIYPKTGYAYLFVTNDGREALAKQAFRQVRNKLDARYAPLG